MTQPAYQVIARRWRPQSFDELVGQDTIVRTLKNAITTGRIAHAYLFVGPRGTGKTSTARIFAKALNCEGGPSITPPVDSPICQSIMQGTCMDVVEIDGASNNSVDQVRDLREDCQYAPAQCRFKIYIIDEVHMLSTAAFNALLKTLEEPPPHVKFIFATTEAQKVLPTIVSRCQRFEFRPISDGVIIQKLEMIAKSESFDVEPEAFASIARLAQGGMRDAQSILEQLIAFCGTTIKESDVLDVYGLARPKDLMTLAQSMAKADYATVLKLIDQLADEGRDLNRVLLDIQSIVRQGLVDAIERGGYSEHLGTKLSTESALRMLESLHAGEGMVRGGLSEKVNLEVILLKAVEQSRTRAIDTLIKELAAISGSSKPELSEKKNDLAQLDQVNEAEIISGPETEERWQVPEAVMEEVVEYSRLSRDPLARVEAMGQQLPHSTRAILEERFRGRFSRVEMKN